MIKANGLPLTCRFVPTDRPGRFAKALASNVDRIITHLEEAVAPGSEAVARGAIAAWLGADSKAAHAVVIRIRDADTIWRGQSGLRDAAKMRGCGPAGHGSPTAIELIAPSVRPRVGVTGASLPSYVICEHQTDPLRGLDFHGRESFSWRGHRGRA